MFKSKFRRVLKEYDSFPCYRTESDCGGEGHGMSMMVDDIIDGEMGLSFGVKLSAGYWMDSNFSYANNRCIKTWLVAAWDTLRRRVKLAARILLGQPAEFTHDFLFSGSEHMRDVIDALQEGLEYCKSKELEKKVLDGRDEGD